MPQGAGQGLPDGVKILALIGPENQPHRASSERLVAFLAQQGGGFWQVIEHDLQVLVRVQPASKSTVRLKSVRRAGSSSKALARSLSPFSAWRAPNSRQAPLR